MVEVVTRARGPYSLALTARHSGDATRRFRDGVLDALLTVGKRVERVERAAATQCPDGSLRIVADSEESLEAMRFTLGIDADHSEFLRRFANDELLGAATRALAGLRQLRLSTPAHALLRALCGQLIESSRARFLERAIVRAVMPARGGLHAPPTAAALAALAPAELRRLGLHARRGATLVRVCSSLDLDRLRDCPAETVARRLGRERGLGPWSVGVVALEGLGRYDLGLVGDLGLIKLLSSLRGRRVEAWETEELLAPYGEWAGLASVYLLSAWARGLLPVSPAQRFAA
jgi:3-methyladenine DNA glycosylase/8-oxoguanine DNA glycosylase